MSRLTFSTMLGLALAICLVAGTMTWHIASFSATPAMVASIDPSIGYAFYSALDQVLANSDRSALDTLISDDFVDHPGEGEVDRSADALVEQLTAFGEVFPDTHMAVRGIAPSNGSLVVSVGPMKRQEIPVAGLDLLIEPSPGGYEVLHIRNGKVTERWSLRLPNVPAATFPKATFSMDGTVNTGLRLDRIHLNSDRAFQWKLRGPAILMVEAGSVRTDLISDDPHIATHHQTSNLDAGSATLLPAGVRIDVQRAGDAPAQVFSIPPIKSYKPTFTRPRSHRELSPRVSQAAFSRCCNRDAGKFQLQSLICTTTRPSVSMYPAVP